MRIDVLLPFHGEKHLLQQAVLSVLTQHHRDFRLVVVDDASPGPPVAGWLADLADPRVSYLRNEHNLGVNANFRRCVELVEAPSFTIMGCDDLMLEDHLGTAARILTGHPEAAVVQPGVEVIDASGAPARPLADRVKRRLAPPGPRVLGGETLAASLLRGNWTYFPSLTWRTASVRATGFRPGLEVALDLALLLDIAATGGALVLEPQLTFRYRRHAASVSSRRAVDGRRFAEEREFFHQEELAARRRGWDRAAHAARLHLTSRLNAASLLPRAATSRDWSVARDLVRHALT